MGSFGYQSTGCEINNSYNIGNVEGLENVGGIVGYLYSGNIKNCYYLTNTSDNGVGNNVNDGQDGFKLETEENMKKPEFVQTLNNGENNWKQDTENKNGGYPILSWQ